ncbi:MAG: hypothetical protein CME59_14585 [Halioglobus sp.]|nr:hypothetical protein [Halioglobus sp.]
MDFVPVDQHNTDAAIDILARAFHDDPVMNWSCNHPPSLAPFFSFTLPVFVPHGLTYLDPEGRGGACWLGPGQQLAWPMNVGSIASILRLGGLRGVYRMLRSGQQTEKHHPELPHYYLFAIGVTPGNKGLGLGSRLIAQQLRICDDEGVPAYLENSKEANLPFYRGHGFEVIKQIRFAPSAPPLWLMWREPRG